MFSLSAPVCSFECQKVNKQRYCSSLCIYVHRGFQYNEHNQTVETVWSLESKGKTLSAACKEELLQQTCYTEPVIEEDDIELWLVIVPLNLINYISCFFSYIILCSDKILVK